MKTPSLLAAEVSLANGFYFLQAVTFAVTRKTRKGCVIPVYIICCMFIEVGKL